MTILSVQFGNIGAVPALLEQALRHLEPDLQKAKTKYTEAQKIWNNYLTSS